MKTQKFLSFFLWVMVASTIYSQTTVSTLHTENGKTFIKVNDVPFPLIGAQIRVDFLMNCDGKTIQQCEPFFEKAQELGVNCVQVPIWWKLIEPTQNNFSWTVLDQILSYVNQYNLKMELLWFSTNMCGESFGNYVPDYILNFPNVKLIRNDGCPYWNYYGYQYNLVLNDPTLLSREVNAIQTMMEHIRVWDNANGAKKPVISVQVHNEPDAFARWRFDQKQIHYADYRPFTKADAWTMTLDALNTVGQAVKNSNYQVVTRTNLITSNGLTTFPEVSGASPIDVYNLAGIDIVASDPYVTSVDIIKSNTLSFLSLQNHYPLIAENKGVYENGASLLLTAVALGSGYDFYDLATSKFVIDNTTPEYQSEIDHGVYTWDLQDKTHTASLKTMIKGLVKAYPDVATTRNDNFVAFNLQSQQPQSVYSQSVNSNKIRFDFSTTSGASGFSITKENYILIYCTENAEVQLFNASFSNPVKGYFNSAGNFVTEGNVSLVDGYILNAQKEILYKINYSGSTSLTSTAVFNIGTAPPDIINYGALNFENESETWNVIDHLHLDWQTNQNYTRNLFAANPEQNGLNKSARCASFSGYYSDNEWWYGLDMVLKNALTLPTGKKYIHALIKSNIIGVDLNKGCLNLNSSWNSIGETWNYINTDWVDYVFPIDSSATSLKEMRFMLNHKTSGQVTYLDELVVSNSPIARTTEKATVSTTPISSITYNSAVCGGNVSWHANSAITQRGCCWSTSQNPTISDSKTVNGSGIGQFSSNLTGLLANTQYYVRSYAENMAGIAYGPEFSFITPEQPFINFENETETWSIIDHLHLDWQTNQAYTRNLYAANPDQGGLNKSAKCASFSGYYSDNEWWYGLDIVLKQSKPVSYGQYIHVMMKTNNTSVDVNRGLMLLNSNGTTLNETWKLISDEWVDYVFPVPYGATEIRELRFMLNHKASGQVTYLDEIIINTDPNPRTTSVYYGMKRKHDSFSESDYLKKDSELQSFIVYGFEKSINILSPVVGFELEVYNIAGKLVYNKLVMENHIMIPVDESGVYLIKSNNIIKKVLVY
jgi:hypothetical protein